MGVERKGGGLDKMPKNGVMIHPIELRNTAKEFKKASRDSDVMLKRLDTATLERQMV